MRKVVVFWTLMVLAIGTTVAGQSVPTIYRHIACDLDALDSLEGAADGVPAGYALDLEISGDCYSSFLRLPPAGATVRILPGSTIVGWDDFWIVADANPGAVFVLDGLNTPGGVFTYFYVVGTGKGRVEILNSQLHFGGVTGMDLLLANSVIWDGGFGFANGHAEIRDTLISFADFSVYATEPTFIDFHDNAISAGMHMTTVGKGKITAIFNSNGLDPDWATWDCLGDPYAPRCGLHLSGDGIQMVGNNF